jgi:hypothetical protein
MKLIVFMLQILESSQKANLPIDEIRAIVLHGHGSSGTPTREAKAWLSVEDKVFVN